MVNSFNINIIGGGRVAFALIKRIINSKLINYINSITIWCRRKIISSQNKEIVFCEETTFEDLLYIYINSLPEEEIKQIDHKIKFVYFNQLEELSVISSASKELDILILTTKYDLNEIFCFDFQNEYDFSSLQLAYERYQQFFLLSETEKETLKEDKYKKFKEVIFELRECKSLLEKEIESISAFLGCGNQRIYNLYNSIFGIKNIGKVLKGYKGFVFNMVNEVDITTNILKLEMGSTKEKCIAPYENDSLRASYFIKKELKKLRIEPKNICFRLLGPHNCNEFLDKNSIMINNILLKDILHKKEFELVVNNVENSIDEFGEKVFLKKGSSDEDTVEGLFRVINYYISAIIDRKSSALFRGGYYDEKNNIYFGGTIYFSSDGRALLQTEEHLDQLYKMKYNEIKLKQCKLQEIVDYFVDKW